MNADELIARVRAANESGGRLELTPAEYADYRRIMGPAPITRPGAVNPAFVGVPVVIVEPATWPVDPVRYHLDVTYFHAVSVAVALFVLALRPLGSRTPGVDGAIVDEVLRVAWQWNRAEYARLADASRSTFHVTSVERRALILTYDANPASPFQLGAGGEERLFGMRVVVERDDFVRHVRELGPI